MLYSLFRPFLFATDPESVHEQITSMMSTVVKLPGTARALQMMYSYSSVQLKQTVFGLNFENPVGMAAGFDKTGQLFPFLSNMGFGFVESGTFTAKPQDGNPKPRLFRFANEQALLNRMGFNNPGSEVVAKILENQAQMKSQTKLLPIRGINIGKSKVTPIEEAEADYLLSLEMLLPYADYMAINVSSPNTPGLRLLQESSKIHSLVSSVKKFITEREIAGLAQRKPIPLLVKFSPDMTDGEFQSSVEAVIAAGADGLILTNTTIDKSKVLGAVNQDGGISGGPVRDRSTELIRRAYRLTEGQLPIIGVGGIFSGQDALQKIKAGASLVQIYTGYIYRGPLLPMQICQYIDSELKRSGKTINQIIGSDA